MGDQILQYAGSALRDSKSIEFYNIQRESTLNLTLRVEGGAQLGKAVKGKSKEMLQAQKKIEEAKRLEEKIARLAEMDLKKKVAFKKQAELRARMELEQKFTRMNLLKIQNQWRKIMRLAKVQSLGKTIDVIKQSHERDVDRKDAIIQMLD